VNWWRESLASTFLSIQAGCTSKLLPDFAAKAFARASQAERPSRSPASRPRDVLAHRPSAKSGAATSSSARHATAAHTSSSLTRLMLGSAAFTLAMSARATSSSPGVGRMAPIVAATSEALRFSVSGAISDDDVRSCGLPLQKIPTYPNPNPNPNPTPDQRRRHAPGIRAAFVGEPHAARSRGTPTLPTLELRRPKRESKSQRGETTTGHTRHDFGGAIGPIPRADFTQLYIRTIRGLRKGSCIFGPILIKGL
jgi:hypothetical protein